MSLGDNVWWNVLDDKGRMVASMPLSSIARDEKTLRSWLNKLLAQQEQRQSAEVVRV